MRGDYTRSFFLFAVKPEVILNTTKLLSNKNCSSITHIPIQVVKSLSNVICISLCHIINNYISTVVFLQSFKRATVLPIHKYGDTSLAHNFRSIFILPDISKEFERVLYNKLCSYLSKYKILQDEQYGFRKK